MTKGEIIVKLAHRGPNVTRQQVTVDARLLIWVFRCPKAGVNPHSEYEPIRATAKYVSLCCHPICCYNIFLSSSSYGVISDCGL